MVLVSKFIIQLMYQVLSRLKTKLLWIEAAGSVTLEFPDLKELVKKPSHMEL